MRVLVAGATGAVGRPLVARLLDAGHDVVGLTRSAKCAAQLRERGADALLCDALDPEQVGAAVTEARPDVVVDQLTSLPRDLDPRRKGVYDANDRIRAQGTGALVDAATAAGVRRYVLQSVAFLYAPEGGWVKDEQDRVWTEAPPPLGRSIGVLMSNEHKVVSSATFEGLVLRYGYFYGPGTITPRTGRSRSESAGGATRHREWRRAHVVRSCRRRGRGGARCARPRRALASTTSSTTTPRRCATGCRATPRRSAPLRRVACRPGSLARSPEPPSWAPRPKLAAPATPAPRASSGGGPRWRAGARASLASVPLSRATSGRRPVPEHRDAIVVGAGFGGLRAAIARCERGLGGDGVPSSEDPAVSGARAARARTLRPAARSPPGQWPTPGAGAGAPPPAGCPRWPA